MGRDGRGVCRTRVASAVSVLGILREEAGALPPVFGPARPVDAGDHTRLRAEAHVLARIAVTPRPRLAARFALGRPFDRVPTYLVSKAVVDALVAATPLES